MGRCGVKCVIGETGDDIDTLFGFVLLCCRISIWFRGISNVVSVVYVKILEVVS